MSVFNPRNYQASSSSAYTGQVKVDQIKDDQGNALSDIILDLVQQNQTEEMAHMNMPTLSGSNTFSGTNTFSSQAKYATGLVPVSAQDLATKAYVDSDKTSANTWAGAQRYSQIVRCDATPADHTQPYHLCTKEYTDSIIGKNTTWSGTNTYGQPILCNPALASFTNDKHLVPKLYVDTSLNAMKTAIKADLDTSLNSLKSSTNVWTGNNLFRNDMQIGDVSGLNNIAQYGNFLAHGPFTYDNIPKTATDITASITDDNHFVTKKYADGLVTSSVKPDTIIYGKQVVVDTSGSVYTVTTPFLGGLQTTTNSTGYGPGDFYINFPDSVSTGGKSYTPIFNSVIVSLYHWVYQANAINVALTSTTANVATFASNITDATLSHILGNNGVKTCIGTYCVINRGTADPSVIPYSQVPTVYSSNATTINIANRVTYSFNNANMSFYPIRFNAVSRTKIKVTINFPNQDNSCLRANWSPNLGFICKIVGSIPSNDTNMNIVTNDLILAPSSKTNSMGGGAWFSTS